MWLSDDAEAWVRGTVSAETDVAHHLCNELFELDQEASLPNMARMMALSLFLFFMYGILAVQGWKDSLHHRLARKGEDSTNSTFPT